MSKFIVFFIVVSAVLFPFAGARAGENTLLALNTPVKPAALVKMAELSRPTTVQIDVPDTGTTDFDVFSALDDPLYRAGSKEFLRQLLKRDSVEQTEKTENKRELRDAPVSKTNTAEPRGKTVVPGPAVNKPNAKKPVHVDPVKIKNIL